MLFFIVFNKILGLREVVGEWKGYTCPKNFVEILSSDFWR